MTSMLSLLENLKSSRVLVIGYIMLDHYLWGDVHRISPEAPVPVVHATHDTYSAGGAANVALNLANLGVKTSILGYCAQDEAGLRLVEILSGNAIEIVCIDDTAKAPTIIKTRVIIRNQQLCRIDREVSRESYRLDENPGFNDMLDRALDGVDAIIISDYAKGVITQELVDHLMNISRQRPGLLIAVDPKPSRNISFQRAGLITPNRNEALEMAGLPQPQYDEKYPLEEVCRRIYAQYNPKLLVITLGAEGMAICQEGKVVKHLPTEAQEVFDVSGAGDTVISTLTAALASGIDPSSAAWLANGAAGCVVAHMGTVPIKLDELQKWLIEHEDKINVS